MDFTMTVRRDISPEKYAQCPNRGRRIKGKTTPQESHWGRNRIGENGTAKNSTENP